MALQCCSGCDLDCVLKMSVALASSWLPRTFMNWLCAIMSTTMCARWCSCLTILISLILSMFLVWGTMTGQRYSVNLLSGKHKHREVLQCWHQNPHWWWPKSAPPINVDHTYPCLQSCPTRAKMQTVGTDQMLNRCMCRRYHTLNKCPSMRYKV